MVMLVLVLLLLLYLLSVAITRAQGQVQAVLCNYSADGIFQPHRRNSDADDCIF